MFSGNLRAGRSRSCGCLQKEWLSETKRGNKNNYKHGHATGEPTPEYRAWAKAKDRCFNPNCVEYFRYGGRGIKMCEEWRHSFAAFLAHVGNRPSAAHSIDRVDNNGDYEPGNVRWATKSEQSANRRPYKRKA